MFLDSGCPSWSSYLPKSSSHCGSCLATRAHQVSSVPRKTSRPASWARQPPKGQFSWEGQAWGLKSQRWVLLGSGKPLARNICGPQGRSQRWIQHLMPWHAGRQRCAGTPVYPRWMLRAPLSSSILPLGSEDENHSAFKQLGPAPMTGKCQGHLTTWLSGCQLLFTTLASLLQWRDCVCLFSLLVHFPSNHENKAVLNHVEARNSVLLDLLCGNLCFRFFPPPLLFTR